MRNTIGEVSNVCFLQKTMEVAYRQRLKKERSHSVSRNKQLYFEPLDTFRKRKYKHIC